MSGDILLPLYVANYICEVHSVSYGFIYTYHVANLCFNGMLNHVQCFDVKFIKEIL